jgi:hypothetical protein
MTLDPNHLLPPLTCSARRGLRLALAGMVVQHRPDRRRLKLRVSWNTANNTVLAEGQRVLIDDPTRLDRGQAIGVGEHA